MSESVSFFVPGIPIPKGSAKAFYNPKAEKIVVMQDNRDKQKPWASAISLSARENDVRMSHDAIKLSVTFYFPRPKSHYRAGKYSNELRPNAPYFHTVKPDLDKLLRCVKDALTGIAWKDDCQVAQLGETEKKYDGFRAPGALITIEAVR